MIDDGSTDDAPKVLHDLKKYRSLRIITHAKNLGCGATVAEGLKSSRFEWVFYTDGDGQYDASELSKLVDKLDDATM